MTGLDTLRPSLGSRHRKKIVGRGEGSGHGGSSTRGRKGQCARSGGGKMTGFEGGQMPLVRRIPKRGFTNIFRTEFNVVNLQEISGNFQDGESITADLLRQKGLVKRRGPIKILGSGDLAKKISIQADAFSGSAIAKIEAAGGKTEIVKRQLEKPSRGYGEKTQAKH